jgi:hypothetical protein
MSQERPTRLHAGMWSVEVERATGWVRCVRLGGHEVARAVYANVRDENWKTLSQRMVHHRAAQEEGRFEAHWQIDLDDIGFTWKVAVMCDGKSLSIDWTGESSQEFQTRRTGLCLLHPLELKGLPCEVVHSDGSVESGAFPILVEPHQPFFDIAGMLHGVGGAKVHISFLGEVFEMEDQRNWTDASFKTYCRPQAWEQPYAIVSGATIQHGVRFEFEGEVIPVERHCVTVLSDSGRPVPMPKLGTLSPQPVPGFAFHIDPDRPDDWSAAGFGRVHYAGANFVDLNRNRPEIAELDAVAFGASPQAHAFDDRTILENVRGLADAVETALEITGGKPVCVGPIRFQNRRVEFDYRIAEPIAAAWIVATVLACAEAGASACCILEAGNFRGPLKDALSLLQGVEAVELLHSRDPYRVIGFKIPGKGAVLVNMRSFTTSAAYDGEHELGPHEVRILD